MTSSREASGVSRDHLTTLIQQAWLHPVTAPVALVAVAVVAGGAVEFTVGQRLVGINTAQVAVAVAAVMALARVIRTRSIRVDLLILPIAVLASIPFLQAARDGTTPAQSGGFARFATVALLLLAMPQFVVRAQDRTTDGDTAEPEDGRSLPWEGVVIAMGAIIAVWALIKIIPLLDDQLGFYDLKYGITLPLGNHNYVAAILVAALTVALVNRPGRNLVGLAAGVMTLGLGVTLSRGGWMAIGAVVIALMILRRDAGTARMVAVLGGLGLVILAVVVVVGGDTDRLTGLVSPASNARIELWGASWDAFLEQPVLGVGIARFPEYMTEVRQAYLHAHQMVLESLAATGIVGTLAYLGYWAAATRRVTGLASRHARLVIGLPLLGLFVHAQVDSLNFLMVYEVIVATFVGVAATYEGAAFVREVPVGRLGGRGK